MTRPTRHLKAAGFVLVFFAAPFAMATWTTAASAQSTMDLESARKLFKEALKEEEIHDFEGALEKYKQVQEVKDTPNIRYRIGVCLEGLGRYASAMTAYEGAVHLGGAEGGSADVVRASAERESKVAAFVPSLTLVLPAQVPNDAEVHVDDQKIDPSNLKEAIFLDPGAHAVTATATGVTPFRTTVDMSPGSHLSLTIPLEPPAPTPPPTPPPAESQDHGPHPNRTTGIVLTATGGALAAAAIVLLVMRSNDISELNASCQNGVCAVPANSQRASDLSATRSRALWEGPVAAGLGIAGAAAIGVGLYLWLKPPASSGNSNPAPSPNARLVPSLDVHGGGLRLQGSF